MKTNAKIIANTVNVHDQHHCYNTKGQRFYNTYVTPKEILTCVQNAL